jgi:hypothetical protein
MIANPAEVWSRSRDDYRPCHAVLAATNKCLAQSNKSGTGGRATKKCEWLVDGPEYTNKPCYLARIIHGGVGFWEVSGD